MDGWFFGDTVNPQHGTIMAGLTSLGYEEQFVKQKTIDVEKERRLGQTWLEKRAEERQAAKPKTNGHAKPKKRAR